MIEVYAKRRGDRCSFFATGHAVEGSERDVVCAGVSALTSALVLHAVSSPARYVRYTVSSGQVFLSCHGLGDAFELVLGGLAAIAEKYPQHVRMAVDDKRE